MRRTILIAIAVLAGSAAAATAEGHSADEPQSVNQCLRHHGWPWGQIALERAVIQHHHPNGLLRICASPRRAEPVGPIARHR